MTIEEKAAVILRKSDAEDREAFGDFTDMFYRKACRLKVKMPMRPFLVAAPRGIQPRHARPEDGQSREQKAKRATLTIIRGGRNADREHPGASEAQIIA